MEAHQREGNPSEGRIKQMLDDLAEILRSLPTDRQDAFREYLDERIKQEEDDGGDSAEGGDEVTPAHVEFR